MYFMDSYFPPFTHPRNGGSKKRQIAKCEKNFNDLRKLKMHYENYKNYVMQNEKNKSTPITYFPTHILQLDLTS